MKEKTITSFIDEIKDTKAYRIVYELKGYILVLIGGLFLSVGLFFFKHLTTTNNIHPLSIIAFRGALISIYSSIYILVNFNKVSKKFDVKLLSSLVFRGSIGGIGMLLVVNSLKYIRVSTCELILRSGNLCSVYIGYFLINEKVTIYDFYGLLSTFMGMMFILKPSFLFGFDTEGEDQMIGVIYACCCSFLIAWGMVLTKKLLESFDEIFTILSMGFIGCLYGMLFSQITGVDLTISGSNLIALIITSAIEFLGMLFNFMGLSYEPIAKVAPFFNSRIIYSVVILYFLNGDIDFFDLIGVSLIVSTYVYISVQKLKMANLSKGD